ncbi:MAG: hypothetical protein BECKG1743D_GA0114223_101372 [Candidatus Kentron sp. G]|nr:MAG: hypothetical protein BECKG1743E_GA0114224_101143 [Candidatus Kentron sp. G]VFM99665.1 MAG: hypothetical protein BECKG1743D_GA0114223_101372 [Candidatus Kentron sp. G]
MVENWTFAKRNARQNTDLSKRAYRSNRFYRKRSELYAKVILHP